MYHSIKNPCAPHLSNSATYGILLLWRYACLLTPYHLLPLLSRSELSGVQTQRLLSLVAVTAVSTRTLSHFLHAFFRKIAYEKNFADARTKEYPSVPTGTPSAQLNVFMSTSAVTDTAHTTSRHPRDVVFIYKKCRLRRQIEHLINANLLHKFWHVRYEHHRTLVRIEC